MIPLIALNQHKPSSVGSSWNDLPDDLKKKIIDSFSLASQTTSCKPVLRLCEDATCDYERLFNIQVEKRNWPPDFQLFSYGRPRTDTEWKLEYRAKCAKFCEVLSSVKEFGWKEDVYDEWSINKEIMLAAVEKNGDALQYASEALQLDRDVVLVAVRKTGQALYFADEKLKRDFFIVQAAVCQDGLALQYAHLDMKKSPEIILEAVTQNPLASQWAKDSWYLYPTS